MQLGIIGLPNSGKTTVFNALTGSNHETSAVSSGKLEILTATVNVPDQRVDQLSAIYKPKKTTYTSVTYNDIGGLDKGIGQGALSGQLRNALATSDGFLHVVRAFVDEKVPHPYNTVDPVRDVETLDGEFLLVDLLTVEKRLERLQEELKKGGKVDKRANEIETDVMQRMKACLEEGNPLRDLELTEEEKKMVRGYGLLSLKPVIIIFNMGEKLQDPSTLITYDHQQAVVFGLQAKIEAEIAQLTGEDKAMFLEEYSIEEPGAARIIQASYHLMHIQSFFTVGPDEVRAWTIPVGATAPQAAGVIHSDLQRGFIRAEVVAYDDFMAAKGDMNAVKAAGKMRMEGKEYIVKNGDILNIRFNV